MLARTRGYVTDGLSSPFAVAIARLAATYRAIRRTIEIIGKSIANLLFERVSDYFFGYTVFMGAFPHVDDWASKVYNYFRLIQTSNVPIMVRQKHKRSTTEA